MKHFVFHRANHRYFTIQASTFQKTISPTNCHVALCESFIFNLAAEWKLRKKRKNTSVQAELNLNRFNFYLIEPTKPRLQKTPHHLTQTFPLIKWKSYIKKTDLPLILQSREDTQRGGGGSQSCFHPWKLQSIPLCFSTCTMYHGKTPTGRNIVLPFLKWYY